VKKLLVKKTKAAFLRRCNHSNPVLDSGNNTMKNWSSSAGEFGYT